MNKVIFLLVLVTFSCSDLEKEAHLGTIKTLESALLTTRETFETIKVDSLFEMQQRTSDLERSLKQNYHSDTVNLAFGRRVDNYKRMRRMLVPLGNVGTKLSNAITEEVTQLQRLFQDVDNGFGARDKYDEYILLETKKCGQIKSLLEDYQKTKTEAFDIYNNEHKFLVSFVEQIMSIE